MIRQFRCGIAGLALMALAAGCSSPTKIDKSEQQSAELGVNLLGESCSAAQRSSSTVDHGIVPPVDILCGKSTRPSGSYALSALPGSLPENKDSRRSMIESAGRASPFGQSQQTRMECNPGKWSESANGVDMLVASCTLRDGHWPYVSLVTVTGDRLAVAEGIPSIIPLIEQAIFPSSKSGKAKADTTKSDPAAAIAQLEAMLGSKPDLFATGDLDAYRAFIELARLYEGGENFAGAERAYLQALQIQSKVLPPDNPGIGETLMNLALQVSNQGRAKEADGIFSRAEPLLQRSVDPLVKARYASYRALDAANRGRFREALISAQDATAERRKLLGNGSGWQGDVASAAVFGSGRFIRGELAQSLYLQAAMAIRVDDIGGAQSAINEALEILNTVPGLPIWWRPRFLSVQAEITQRLGKVEDAESQLAVAIEIDQRLFGETLPTANLYMSLGRLYASEGLPDRAVDTFRRGRTIFQRSSGGRIELTAPRLMPYLDSLQELTVRRPERIEIYKSEMFEISQMADAGVASKTIAKAATRVALSDPNIAKLVRASEDSSRERDRLQLQLATEAAKPSDRRDPAIEQALTEQLRKAAEQTRSLEQQISTNFPGYAQLSTPRSVGAETVAKKLNSGEAFVSFLFGPTKSYGFLITASGTTVKPLELTTDELSDLVRTLRKPFQSSAATLPAFDLALSHLLYKKLLGPFAQQLEPVKHLIVAASGALSSLPPALLITEPPPPAKLPDYVSAAWLAKKTAISVVPTPDAFLRLRQAQAKAPASKTLVGFANPSFTGSEGAGQNSLQNLAAGCRNGEPVSREFLRALAPLPETADELRAVAKALHASNAALFTGDQATEAEVHKIDLQDYRVLYFATHGLLPGELRCQSEPALALTPPDHTASAAEDGLLEASEIATLQLDADLVVLSACNTAGDSEKLGGQALSGLAESFFFAGGRSILASHWHVSSASTVGLMTGLFQRLGPDLSPGIAQSLREAQLVIAARKETSHPAFWAAFTLVGDGAPRRIQSVGAPGSDKPTPSPAG